jgi:hypothetical protein
MLLVGALDLGGVVEPYWRRTVEAETPNQVTN